MQSIVAISKVRALAAALLASAAALIAGCGLGPEPVMETIVIPHGPFEIVASGQRISSGAFPNNSGKPFSTVEVTAFSVRWHGKAVDVPEVGTHFWRVLRLMDAPQPTLLVMTTDFHLITEVDGRLVVTSMGPPSTDMAEIQWLDGRDGQPGPATMFGIQKVDPVLGTELRGGRWLRLSSRIVLDVKTLTPHAVQTWVPTGTGKPMAGLAAGSVSARAFSPGQTQFVLPASDNTVEGRVVPGDGLVVVDILGGDPYPLHIDHRQMRYADWDDITDTWIAHYFEWRRDAQGRELLVQRAHPKPLPWRGRFIAFGDKLEYRVQRATPPMATALQRFAVEQLGAQPAPDALDPSRVPSNTYTLPGCDHVVVISYQEDHAGIYVPTAKAPPWERCQDTVRKIGAAFDVQLASGRLDALFKGE